MEIELKFALSPQRQRNLEKLLGKLARTMSGPVRRHLITQYFDFADRALLAAGFSLRVRQSDGEYVQTLKSLAGEGGAALARFEREWTLMRNRLDVTRLAGTPISRLMAARREAPIRLAFTTDVTRVTYMLALEDDAIVEVAVDNGHVRSGENAQAIHEVEFELKAGSPAALYRFAAAFHEARPLAISADSKAMRGYRLAAGRGFEAGKAKDLVLPRNVTVAEGFRRILGNGIAQFVTNLPFCSTDDPEPLHQARVAVRRIRSALTWFGPYLEPEAAARFEDTLKRFGRILGEARDRDVFVRELADEKTEDRQNGTWLEMVVPPIEAERRAAYRGVQTLINSGEPTAFILALAGWAESGLWLRPDSELNHLPDMKLTIVVPDMLDKLASKASKRGRHLKDRSLGELHSLRKTLKKLRYCTEYSETLYKHKRVKRYQERAKELLEVLGALNDTVGADTLLDTLNTKDATLTPGIGLISRVSIANREEALKRLPKVWKAFAAEKPFWA
ncbi:MAG TPA: CHAD domain-containing protein [Alphaproteobacteria bacterium]|jgi:inorganic triphosphatase YgiF|nr:CHAD domain-containing protein [Alphaproteobacteria bacterium]